MTLERIEHKVFASEAPLDEMGQFGSALATTRLNTKDVAEIQALPAYTKGWGGAIISENNYPAMEEMNGVLNVMSYHTGYLYQEGIPIYSATQEYSATSWVKDLAGKNIYKSKKDNNIGNDLNDSEWFERVDFGGNSLKKSQITNCLLEVPQKIKLELADGVLTLKAGSEVIVPNGFEADGTTPKFDYVTIESDEQLEVSDSENLHTSSGWFVFLDDNGTRNSKSNYSGTTAPSLDTDVNYAVWYDTANNIIKYTNNNGATWTTQNSTLPLCHLTRISGITISIDQTFNGIGYIGSTVWVDKGVKGLIPNGRNEDGSLRNIEFITDNLLSFNEFNNDTSNYAVIDYNGGNLRLMRSAVIITDYDFSNNFIKREDGLFRNSVMVAVANCSTNGITNFQPKQPFRAVDYSDSSTVSGWGMPSNKIVQLTVGASGTVYTAPANGYFACGAKKVSASDSSYINFDIENNGQVLLRQQAWIPNAATAGNTVRAFLPCAKGQRTVVAYYNATIEFLQFVYAEGDQ